MLFSSMSFSTAYRYSDRNIFDIQTLIAAIRFIFVNVILAFIFIFLSLEEIDWALLSSNAKINYTVIDNTSWNIKTIF